MFDAVLNIAIKNKQQRLWCAHRLTWIIVLISFCSLFASQFAIAQTSFEAANNDKVSALLDEIQSKQKTRSIYAGINGTKIADVAASKPFTTVKHRGQWSMVRFNSRTVPGWVSVGFVELAGNEVTVDASSLNVRMQASLGAKILATVPRGYRSRVLEQRSGFVKILLPSSFPVAIRSVSTAGQNTASQGSSSRAIALNSRESATKPIIAAGVKPPTANSSAAKPPVEQSTSSAGKNPNSTERSHIISPGDAISLLVFGERDLSAENLRVPQSGRVSLPLIGSVLVAGKTTAQVEEVVSELLAQGYVRNPRLSVTIFSYRPIFIRGAVRQTGSFPFSEGLTISKAIALAGGSKKSANPKGVSILREGKVVQDGLSIDSQVEIDSGDVISIAEEVGVSDDDASYIYLHGEVASPGEYLYRRGLTVEKAIVLAGGFTLRASRKKVSVTRYAESDEDGKPKRLKRVKLYEPIEPGDVILVGASWL